MSRFLLIHSEQLNSLIEENRKQKEMIVFLLERNKQLQECAANPLIRV